MCEIRFSQNCFREKVSTHAKTKSASQVGGGAGGGRDGFATLVVFNILVMLNPAIALLMHKLVIVCI